MQPIGLDNGKDGDMVAVGNLYVSELGHSEYIIQLGDPRCQHKKFPMGNVFHKSINWMIIIRGYDLYRRTASIYSGEFHRFICISKP